MLCTEHDIHIKAYHNSTRMNAMNDITLIQRNTNDKRLFLTNVRTSLFFFFFQAEDGIRDLTVTGVQTCALPIFRTPVTSEDPAPRRDVSPRVGPRAEEGLFSDDGTRVDRRVDAHLHVVPHDHAKLPQSGVDLDPAEHDLHGRLVESEVRHLCARAEVASLAEDAVPDVVLMGHVGGGHQDRILHLAGVPDFRLRAAASARSAV